MGSCYSSSKGKKTIDPDIVRNGASNSTKRQNSIVSSLSGRWKKSRDNAEGELHCIPGRISTNGSTETSSLYTQQGKKGINQDAMLVWENFSPSNDTVFCGVFDGHGPFGHMVAKKVRDSLPLMLCTQWKASSSGEWSIPNGTGDAPSCAYSDEAASLRADEYEHLEVEENEKLPENYLPLKRTILEAFKLMDKELKLHPTIDCFCSGTTAVTLIKQDIVISNVGDSRAVLATRDIDKSLLAVQLTIDLKPDLPREAARIQQCKGRVFALQDEPEVARVWLPNSDSPGLAMARAFGDFCLKDFGLISVPDIYYHRLTERDEFIILATDGVWDVLSNKEAVDIVASAPGHATAARALVDCAVRAWRLKYPTSKNDDCAVVCLFFENIYSANEVVEGGDATKVPEESIESDMVTNQNIGGIEGSERSHTFVLEHLDTLLAASDEIVPVSQSVEDKFPVKSQVHKRSLAECISAAEDEEWSALDGLTRVNSLLSLPRLFSGDKGAASWRKWF
ncbi:probable protein phosphatase 2C 6 isoform X2 [Tripterygium wilfordii]|uniref:probable protein phosphatase 2C 6 isoform X2 n=1 Tax=Tripterygium wilfordii TaxID=458696 RepID=UPI0018F82A72|nr:probable protein phosphatase 2C 6 isoform X2 [Tripterygium wilfordii]